MKWFENNSWRLEKCHSRFFVTPDLFRGRISLFTFFFSLVFLVLLSACTDYVSQIDDRYGEWETSIEPNVKSSSSAAKSSSSSVAKSSSSEAWLLQTGSFDIIIYSNGMVTDTQGNKIGTYDMLTGSINDADGKPIIVNVDLNMLPKYDPEAIAATTSSSSDAKSSSSWNVVIGIMADSRDGQIYKTVTIGSQTWMAQNLNYESENSWCGGGSGKNEGDCSKYGRSYTWAAAVGKTEDACGYGYDCYSLSGDIQGVCPTGWHLPSLLEWEILFTAVGYSIAGKVLKSTSGWINGGNGTDEFSFSVLPSGMSDEWGCYDIGVSAYFWSSTEFSSHSAGHILLSVDDYWRMSDFDKFYGFPVRCIKDDASMEHEESSSSKSDDELVNPADVIVGSMTDSRDGKNYKTVTIGSQTWMAQNLNYETENSYCYNDTASYCAKYGRLYTWAAAVDKTEDDCGFGHICFLPSGVIQGACPTGWHLPSQTEWNSLFTAIGGYSTAGKALKSSSGWRNGGYGTDVFSFSALPAGYGSSDGSEQFEGGGAYFWSSTEIGSNSSLVISLYYDRDSGARSPTFKNDGFSVRCVKD